MVTCWNIFNRIYHVNHAHLNRTRINEYKKFQLMYMFLQQKMCIKFLSVSINFKDTGQFLTWNGWFLLKWCICPNFVSFKLFLLNWEWYFYQNICPVFEPLKIKQILVNPIKFHLTIYNETSGIITIVMSTSREPNNEIFKNKKEVLWA